MKKRSSTAYFAAPATTPKVRKRPKRHKHHPRAAKTEKAKKRRRSPRLRTPLGLKTPPKSSRGAKIPFRTRKTAPFAKTRRSRMWVRPRKESLTKKPFVRHNRASQTQLAERNRTKNDGEDHREPQKRKNDRENAIFCRTSSKRLEKPNSARTFIRHNIQCFLLAAIVFEDEEKQQEHEKTIGESREIRRYRKRLSEQNVQ